MRHFVTLFIALLAGAAAAQPVPEGASGRVEKPLAKAEHWMVAAANPLAAQAGREILRAGGSAVDAAVAVQMVLGLVEPQSSGIGGGAFLLHWSESGRVIESWDGRETAPAAAEPDRFLRDGKPLGFKEAVLSGASVGVPGVVRMLEAAHKEHGKLAWRTLFAPAIVLAEAGFPMSPRLHKLLSEEKDFRSFVFHEPDGTPKPVGTRIVNQAYAEVLKKIAFEGPGVFYEGEIAREIAAAAGSDMTPGDLAQYETKHREPVCGEYRVWVVCGMAPPSSGGVAVLQILGALERFDMPKPGPEAVHLFSEAARLAYADRAKWLGDPALIPVPLPGLVDRAYVRERAALIDTAKSMKKAEPGDPPRKRAWEPGADSTMELPGTSHVSIVDGEGNAVAMTTTIEDAFGSRRMVRGFLLNNQLTDFAFRPEEDGKPVANRIEGGKRPRSSMAPTMVFTKEGQLVAVVGSPGGSQIINYVAQTLVAMLDWGMDPQQAVSLPHFGSRNGPTELEPSPEAEGLKTALEPLGHDVRVVPMTSGLHAIRVTRQGLEGGADPRREGVALGD